MYWLQREERIELLLIVLYISLSRELHNLTLASSVQVNKEIGWILNEKKSIIDNGVFNICCVPKDGHCFSDQTNDGVVK